MQYLPVEVDSIEIFDARVEGVVHGEGVDWILGRIYGDRAHNL